MNEVKDSVSQDKTSPQPPEKPDEASLIWDEYKYRHDLIWRHLIRSTLALVALITVPFANAFEENLALIIFAWLAALVYWRVTYTVVQVELRLFSEIKYLHRLRQSSHFQIHKEWVRSVKASGKYHTGNFAGRVNSYLYLLLAGTIMAGIIALVTLLMNL